MFFFLVVICSERENYRKIQKEEYEGDSDVESDDDAPANKKKD